VLALASVASLMVALDALVVSTALSTIRVDLHASLADLEWTVNAYVLSFAVLLMTGAALGDRLGRKRLFIIGMGISPPGLPRARSRKASAGSSRLVLFKGPERRS